MRADGLAAALVLGVLVAIGTIAVVAVLGGWWL